MNSFPRKKIEPDSDGEDIPLSKNAERICEMAFNQLKPTTVEGCLRLVPWRELWVNRKSCFTCTGEPHQKNPFDRLHLSVRYTPYLGPTVFFHIYGYQKNIFLVTDITILYPAGPEKLCSFQ